MQLIDRAYLGAFIAPIVGESSENSGTFILNFFAERNILEILLRTL
jgi:hypothetical protein